MRKVSGELLHLADCIALIALAQHSVVSAHDVVALPLGRVLIASRGKILLDLAEDPWIRRSGAADHHCIAARFTHHANRVLWRDDVAIADHGDISHRGFYFRDSRPIRLAAITLFARARMEGNRLKPAILSCWRR